MQSIREKIQKEATQAIIQNKFNGIIYVSPRVGKSKIVVDAIKKLKSKKARNNFIEFVKEMIIELSAIDNSLSALNAKDCIFRINRDIRFSKDKRPYKNNFAAYFNKGGKKGPGAGYYLHAEPGKCFMACGVWMPEPKMLADIRQEIDYNCKEFESILKSKKFKPHFESGLDETDILSRPPKGYDAENPAVNYLKLKSKKKT
jgi:uncharacterized protein (TIGR02453 family)